MPKPKPRKSPTATVKPKRKPAKRVKPEAAEPEVKPAKRRTDAKAKAPAKKAPAKRARKAAPAVGAEKAKVAEVVAPVSGGTRDERGLTPRQARFVDEYLLDLNATQAAIRAGYAEANADVTGPRLLGNAGVARAIDEAKRARSARVVCDQDWVLEKFRTVTERCLQEQPVFNARGQIIDGVWQFDSKGANTALRSIGDHHGMFKQKLELTGKDGGPVEVSERPRLSPEEVATLREIRKRKQAAEASPSDATTD